MRDGDFELVTLRGGARAVRHVGHGEVMHPSTGPWREANELYVKQSRLADTLKESGREPLCLYDVGLGAGTNLIAALNCARLLGAERARELRVFSFERDLAPLRLALSDAAGFPFLVDFAPELKELISKGRFAHDGIAVTLLLGDALTNYERTPPADLIFFDPFSPAANPEMWTVAAFRKLLASCDSETTLFTYSAATPTRVSLLLAGFYVGVGDSIGAKKETTAAATRLELLASPLGARWLDRWRRSSARAPHGGGFEVDEIDKLLLRHPQFK